MDVCVCMCDDSGWRYIMTIENDDRILYTGNGGGKMWKCQFVVVVCIDEWYCCVTTDVIYKFIWMYGTHVWMTLNIYFVVNVIVIFVLSIMS